MSGTESEMVSKVTADDVYAVFERIRAEDPDAYAGYVVDAACRIVARRQERRAIDVLRDFRTHYPTSRGFLDFRFPPRALRPRPEVVERVVKEESA